METKNKSAQTTRILDNRIFTHDDWLTADKVPHKMNSTGYNMSFLNGKLSEEGQEIDGMKQGIWIRYYENGNIKSIISYLDGVEDGVYKTFFENGQIEEEGYRFRYSRPTYKDSIISETETMILIYGDKEQKHGLWKKYDSLGKVIDIKKYSKGQEIKQ